MFNNSIETRFKNKTLKCFIFFIFIYLFKIKVDTTSTTKIKTSNEDLVETNFNSHQQKSHAILLQTLIPFFIAGFGMVRNI